MSDTGTAGLQEKTSAHGCAGQVHRAPKYFSAMRLKNEKKLLTRSYKSDIVNKLSLEQRDEQQQTNLDN